MKLQSKKELNARLLISEEIDERANAIAAKIPCTYEFERQTAADGAVCAGWFLVDKRSDAYLARVQEFEGFCEEHIPCANAIDDAYFRDRYGPFFIRGFDRYLARHCEDAA